MDGRFYGYLLKSDLFIQALRLTANFIRDGQDMHFGHFRSVKLPRLPRAEQVRIADYLDREITRIDGLIHETERSIELLKEKRSALITAAVTGKIDVRIPRVCGHRIHEHVATDSTSMWPPVPRHVATPLR